MADDYKQMKRDQTIAYRKNLKLISSVDKKAYLEYYKLLPKLQSRIGDINTDPGKFMDKFINVYGSELHSGISKAIKDGVISSAKLGAEANSNLIISRLGENSGLLDNAINRAYGNVITGSIYKDKIALDQRIAKNINYDLNKLKDIVVKQFVNESADARTLAKILQKEFYGDNYKAAIRTARTTINHGFRLGTIESSKDNPFVIGLQWNLSGSHPRDDECDDFANANDFDLGDGVYPFDDVPFSHPNCLCYLTPVVKD